MSLFMRCTVAMYLYNRQDVPGTPSPRLWRSSSFYSSPLAFSFSWDCWRDLLLAHYSFLLDQEAIQSLAIFSTYPLKHHGLSLQSGRNFTVRCPSNRTTILWYIRTNLGDIVYVDFPGQPTIVLNSIKAAFDLLDKRSDIYSDRPVSLTLKL